MDTRVWAVYCLNLPQPLKSMCRGATLRWRMRVERLSPFVFLLIHFLLTGLARNLSSSPSFQPIASVTFRVLDRSFPPSPYNSLSTFPEIVQNN